MTSEPRSCFEIHEFKFQVLSALVLTVGNKLGLTAFTS